MNKFAVIIPYFGKFKPSIKLFLESCNRNNDIDWLFFTDIDAPAEVILQSNIYWSKTTLEAVRELAVQKIGFDIKLDRAYKLCDLRPFYGLVFSDYIKDYEYWGYGDTDVICGRISKFLLRAKYNAFDKVNWMGHLSFLRNSDEINHVALTDIEGTVNAKDVLNNEKNVGFDEHDFNRKLLARGKKIYTGLWAADMDIFYWRMRCVDIKTFHKLLGIKEIDFAPKNYAKQIFALADGAIYRFYIEKGTVKKDEFAYIHFRKEAPIDFEDYSRGTFIISREGFYKATSEELEDLNRLTAAIEKYNNQETPFQEWKNYIIQYYRKNTGKRGW